MDEQLVTDNDAAAGHVGQVCPLVNVVQDAGAPGRQSAEPGRPSPLSNVYLAVGAVGSAASDP